MSLLSQWNDKNQRAINTLELQLENVEEDKRKCLAEMEQMQLFEQVRLYQMSYDVVYYIGE